MNDSGTPLAGNPSDLPLEQQGLLADPVRWHLEIQVRGSALVAGIVDTSLERLHFLTTDSG